VVLAMTATGLAAARALHRRGVTVYGVDHKRWEIGHHSAEIRRPPFAFEAAGPRLAELITEWARGQEAPPVLIPADDPHCDFVSNHHSQLRESCLLPEGYCPEIAGSFVDKRQFYQRCQALGVDLPRTLFPRDLAELEDSSRDLLFPAILKPAHSHLWRKRFHGRKVIEVGSRDELLTTFRSLGDLQTGMTVQEVIPGAEREIFVCAAYFGRNGEPRALLTARKTRQYPPDFGSGSLVRSEWRPEVAESSVQLVPALGYKGICGTEYKPDPRDGKWKLIEVNPRPTLWFGIWLRRHLPRLS
jgi:predicted ATP-grasp superfamily ATP-dependent carboligase